MAFSVNGGNGGRRRHGSGSYSEINVVPLVDVVLVLLVIFMLTAHVMEFGLEVEVPKVKASRDSAEELPIVALTKDGRLYLGESEANINRLAGDLKQRFPEARAVYLRADGQVIWDTMAQVVAALGESKLEVRLVTQPDDGGAGRKR
jgi:biopolymer transport protein ExbD